jgi:diguanylate cyclase (GGDEF)-like protein
MARANFLNLFPKNADSQTGGRSASASDALSLLRNFEESCRGWFWSTDDAGQLTYVSPSVSHLLSDLPQDFIGTAFANLFVPPHDAAPARDRLPFVLGKRSSFEKLVLQSANPATPKWWEISGRAQLDSANNFKGFLGYAVDVTEQLQSSESASQLAMFDPLTSLPNRLNMSRFLESSLLALNRPGGSCAVILIDLDRFKQVNDSLGHAAGDALLKIVSDRLLGIIGAHEKIFRLGGDEFQIVLPGCEDRGTLGEIANKIIASLSQPYSVEGSRCVIGASIGVAIGPFDGRTGEDLMRNADLALYAAKGGGRGCFRFFSSSLLEVAEDRRVLEVDLRDALANDQLSLFYQPVVSTATSSVTGVEALVRWQHPKRGFISPAVFIPIAEEANLINHLGEWILRKACNDAANWPAEIRVAVNVSPIQFANEALPAIVMSALAHSGLPPSRLELELTEGVFLSESTETDTMFSNLKDIGVRLALDDFGTGYSSLGYLKTAPFDKIKIDQSFVRGATLPGSRNGAIIAAIVALAGALDMETTAEGIESLDQLDLIRGLGVSHIQGYVYSKPIPEAELCEKLAQGAWSLKPMGPAKQRSDRRSLYRKAGAIVGNFYHAVIIRNPVR